LQLVGRNAGCAQLTCGWTSRSYANTQAPDRSEGVVVVPGKARHLALAQHERVVAARPCHRIEAGRAAGFAVGAPGSFCEKKGLAGLPERAHRCQRVVHQRSISIGTGGGAADIIRSFVGRVIEIPVDRHLVGELASAAWVRSGIAGTSASVRCASELSDFSLLQGVKFFYPLKSKTAQGRASLCGATPNAALSKRRASVADPYLRSRNL
jgi:hypothetical protein